MHLVHLEEEDTGSDEDEESDDPSRIEGVTEELMVCLARAVKDTQQRRSTAIIVVAQNILSIIVCS